MTGQLCVSLELNFTTNAFRMTSPWASASPEPNIHDRGRTPSLCQTLHIFSAPFVLLGLSSTEEDRNAERNGVKSIPGLLAFTSQELLPPKPPYQGQGTGAAG